MAYEVVLHPAKVLRRIARRIEPGDGLDLAELYAQMLETMDTHEGVGLAAPQIGKSIRFIVAHNIESRSDQAFVNPQILEGSAEMQVGPEGCLSIPDLYGDIERHLSVRLRWQDLDFKTHEETFSGHFARVLQHEVDHLNGILILDKAIGGMYERAEDEEDEGGEGEAVGAVSEDEGEEA